MLHSDLPTIVHFPSMNHPHPCGACGRIGRIGLVLAIACAIVPAACGGATDTANITTATPPTAQPAILPAAAASVSRVVDVPEALAGTPFTTPRSLVVPPGFGIRVWSRVSSARFLARAPNGDILVSQPALGTITLLREHPDAVPDRFDFATGLQHPQDMVFHQIGQTTWLYIAESNRVSRVAYQPGMTQLSERQVVIDGLPDSSTAELKGSYGHELKNIALGPDDKLYLSIASTCNACTEDVGSDPVRGAIYQYNADGSGGRLFARGLRNAEGLDFIPGTNSLWAAVNNRDEIPVPVDMDVDGDGTDDIGKVMPQYVDDNPPDPFTLVSDGANYGWPFCNAVPNAAMSNLDMLPDYDLNRNSGNLDCATVTRASKGIPAHSAPLGLSFLHNSNVPEPYRSGAAIALHGCWNCTTLRSGYKVVYIPFDAAGNAGSEMDLVTGFVIDPVARTLWGRPVDVIADGKGGLLISDDYADAVYQLYPL